MKHAWFLPAVRLVLFAYFAIGVAGLVAGGLFGVVVPVLFVVFVLASWNSFGKPIPARNWIALGLLGTLGIVRIIFFNQGWPFAGGGAA